MQTADSVNEMFVDMMVLPGIGDRWNTELPNFLEIPPEELCVQRQCTADFDELGSVPPSPFDAIWGGSLGQDHPMHLASDTSTDEPAQFVHFINSEQPSLPSKGTCDSPTLITASLSTTNSPKKKKNTRPKSGFVAPERIAEPAATAAATTPPLVAEASRAAEGGSTQQEDKAPADASTGPDAPVEAVDGESVKLDLSAFDEELNTTSDDPAAASGMDKKKYDRMMRNRASAAQSRKRKRQHVEELQALVARLKEELQALKKENMELRQDCARAGGTVGSLSVEVPVPPLPQVNSAACA